jgi:hypothetical protein
MVLVKKNPVVKVFNVIRIAQVVELVDTLS